MRFSAASVLALPALISAAPFQFPLKNNFPNPSAKDIAIIEKFAGGTLPNGPLPTKVKAGGINALRLIALNEIFEVAFFTELLHNMTMGVPGYTSAGALGAQARDIIFSIRAQEELHALSANAALKNLKEAPIQPCKYDFPVSSFDEAIALAATFTDVVLGTLPAAQQLFAEDAGEEIGLIPFVGSVQAQEGEQTGVYRLLQKKVPSAAPFLTGGSPDFAFTAIQSFIVPGSCPNIKDIDLKTFKPLTILNTPAAKNMTLKYEVTGTVTSAANSLVYMTGQRLPLTVPISAVTTSKGVTTFEAEFPFEGGFSRGLTLAALVKGSKTFATPNDVAASTIYGPGLIEVE